MCKGDDSINSFELKNARLVFFKTSLLKDNIYIGRVLVKSTEGVFPLVCFNSFTSLLSSIKEDDDISVEGTLKDYCYSDYNGVSHYVKLILVKTLWINGVKWSVPANEENKYDSFWNKIKNIYQVLDVLEFEKLSEGAV